MTSLKLTVAGDTDSSVTAGTRAPHEQSSDAANASLWGSRLQRRAFLIVLIIGMPAAAGSWSALGFNSDEAVYAGQAASIAGRVRAFAYFPIFRAHPLLFQPLLKRFPTASGWPLTSSAGSSQQHSAWAPSSSPITSKLPGRRAGIVSMAKAPALMPYHVTVSRQVLLDAPMVFFATAALYALVRYCSHRSARWLIATGALMGLAILTKETAIVLFGGIYCFVLNQTVKLRFKRAAQALAVAGVIAIAFPSHCVSPAPGRGAAATTWPGSCFAAPTIPSTST